MKRFIFIVFGAICLLMATQQDAFAQFGIGGTYEQRDELPKVGYGVRMENTFKVSLPLLRLGWRAHYSQFSESKKLSDNANTKIKSDSWDAGLALFAEVKMPLMLNPYAGMGLGYEKQNTDNADLADKDDSIKLPKGESLYYNAFIGLKMSAIPVIKPFVEYRYSGFNNVKEIRESPGRFMFGVVLQF